MQWQFVRNLGGYTIQLLTGKVITTSYTCTTIVHNVPDVTCSGGVGLIKSSLAIQLSANFIFEDDDSLQPSGISWNDQVYQLSHAVLELLNDRPALGRYAEMENE